MPAAGLRAQSARLRALRQRSAISERLVSLMEAARKAEALHELETKRKPRRQTLSPSDVELLRNWSRVRPELPELIAAPDLTARIPVAGTRSCDAVRDPSHCCYRTNLTERLEVAASTSGVTARDCRASAGSTFIRAWIPDQCVWHLPRLGRLRRRSIILHSPPARCTIPFRRRAAGLRSAPPCAQHGQIGHSLVSPHAVPWLAHVNERLDVG